MKKQRKRTPLKLNKGMKVGIGIVLFLLAALLFGTLFTDRLSGVVKQELSVIRSGDIDKAYTMTSDAFQAETSIERFRAFVDTYPILTHYKKFRIVDERLNDGQGYLIGQLVDENSQTTTIEFQLAKIDRSWKIQAIRLSLDLDNSLSTPDKSGAIIQDIYVNDVANPDGYTSEGKAVLSKNAKKIFATIQITTPQDGITVYATLTYLPTNAKIGPSSGEITRPGNILKAFSFTRDNNLWPVGQYQIDVNLSSGAKKSVRFIIQ